MPETRAVLQVLGAGGLFGTAGTAAALGPAGTTAVGIGIVRIAVGALTLVAAMPLLGQSPRRLIGLWRTRPMLVTAVCAGMYQVFFFAGVARAGVALGTLVAVGSAPIAAGLLGWAVTHHRPTSGWVVATATCLLGLALLTSPELTGSGGPLGILLALGAGACIAGYNVAAKVQLSRGVSPLEVSAASFVLGGLALLPVLATQPLGWLAQPSGVALALYLGAATMALANYLLARGMHRLRPGPATTLMLADPAVATILSVVVLGEVLATQQVVGTLVIMAGLLVQSLLAGTDPGGAAVASDPHRDPEKVPDAA